MINSISLWISSLQWYNINKETKHSLMASSLLNFYYKCSLWLIFSTECALTRKEIMLKKKYLLHYVNFDAFFFLFAVCIRSCDWSSLFCNCRPYGTFQGNPLFFCFVLFIWLTFFLPFWVYWSESLTSNKGSVGASNIHTRELGAF